MSDNFYEILGVHEKATKDEIKRAYRSLQMKYHPDKNLGNSECMMMTQKINEAYETIQITMHQAYHGVSIPIDVERWVMEQGCKANEHEIIYVDIPPGIDNEIIVIKEKGNVISEQCKGDVKVTVMVENNTEFKRAGLDLIYEKTSYDYWRTAS